MSGVQSEHQNAIRLQAQWGTHSAVVAARALLRAALTEPTNDRFQLLSAATLPLWPPAVVYARLMAQPRSHLDACHPPVRPRRQQEAPPWSLGPRPGLQPGSQPEHALPGSSGSTRHHLKRPRSGTAARP